MSATQPPANAPSAPPRTLRVPIWFKRVWPFFFWLGACALAGALWLQGARVGGMPGWVVAATESVSALETARLLDVRVRPGQTVRAGDLLALFDPALIDAEIATEEAILREAESTITGYQQNILQLTRQLEAAVQEAETALALEQLQQKQDQAQLEELERELLRLEGLRERQLTDEAPLASLRPEIAALRAAIAFRPEILAVLERRLAADKARSSEAGDWLRADREGDTAASIARKMAARKAIHEANLALLTLRKENLSLRATRDGVVSEIFFEPGAVVPAEEVILRMVLDGTTHVEGFLPEASAVVPELGQTFHVRRVSGRSPAVPARVLAIAPDIAMLPERFHSVGAPIPYGRRVLFALDGPTDLLPGERVQVRGQFSFRVRP